MICKKCSRRFGIEGVDYWSAKLSLCSGCEPSKDNKQLSV